MNRLVFSEGGQPVCLDDLKLLQELFFESMKPFLKALVKTDVFILEDYIFQNSELDEEKGETKFTLLSGTLVVNGDFLTWPDTDLSIQDWNQPIYLCVKNVDSDMRLFEDGQSRNCTKSKKIYASTDKTGADEAYNIYNLHSLLDFLSSALELGSIKENLDVQFYNGYSGKVKISKVDNGTDAQISIDIKTSRTDWDTEEALLSRGMLFTINDATYAETLQGKKSPSFEYLGKKYELHVAAKPVAAVVILTPEGGIPNGFYDDDYSFPIIPISVTFKLGDFVKFSK